MKIRFLLTVVCVVLTTISSAPTLVSSQQAEVCDMTQLNNKKPEPTSAEFCVCEQSSAAEKPTY